MSKLLFAAGLVLVFTAIQPGVGHADVPSHCKYGKILGVFPVEPRVAGDPPFKLRVELADPTALLGVCNSTRYLVANDAAQSQAVQQALTAPGATMDEDIQAGGNRTVQILDPIVARSTAGSLIKGWGGFFALFYSSSQDDRVPSDIRSRITVYQGGVDAPGLHIDADDAILHNVMFNCLSSQKTIPNYTDGTLTCTIPAKRP